MKYIICDGNRKLKYLTIFSSMEEITEYLHSMYDFVYLIIQKINSAYAITNCYNCSLCHKGHDYNVDLLIYGVKDYEQKEEI